MHKLDNDRLKTLSLIYKHDQLGGSGLHYHDPSISLKGVYTLLKRMENQGLLSSELVKIPGERNRPRRLYKLTNKGRDLLIMTKKQEDFWWWLSLNDDPEPYDPEAKDFPYKDSNLRENASSIVFNNLITLEPSSHVRYAFDFDDRFDQLHIEIQAAAACFEDEYKLRSVNFSKALYGLPDDYKKTLLYKYIWKYFRDDPFLLRDLECPAAVISRPNAPEHNIPLLNEDITQSVLRYVYQLSNQLLYELYVIPYYDRKKYLPISASEEVYDKSNIEKILPKPKYEKDIRWEELPDELQQLFTIIVRSYYSRER